MKKSEIVTVGFMLFAMFFGAGNLIFPPAVGFQSGLVFTPALLGFLLTGVGLPLLGVLGGLLADESYHKSLAKISPWFATLVLSSVQLTIGPLFAIPRTATTSYELFLKPLMGGQNNTIALFLFSLAFFALTLYVAIGSHKLSDAIGRVLTPGLLFFIVLIIIRSFFLYRGTPQSNTDPLFSSGSPFGTGVVQGYQTMDAIAALSFSFVVVSSVREYNVQKKNELIKGAVQSTLLASVLLGAIYAALAWIGNHSVLQSPLAPDANLGVTLLHQAADSGFGSSGTIILGVIVLLACLTTSSGLVVAVGEFFYSLYPKISLKTYEISFTVISFILSNLGLNAIIGFSVPVLGILYPVVIMVIFFTVLRYFFSSLSMEGEKWSLYFTLIISFFMSLASLKLFNLPSFLPLTGTGFEWLTFTLIGFLFGWVISLAKKKE